MGRGEDGGEDMKVIQWAGINRERKRWMVGGKRCVRDSARCMVRRDNIDSSVGFWQMFKELANGKLVPT